MWSAMLLQPRRNFYQHQKFPGLASSLNQFKADGVTAIANQN